jgi:prepilin-type N-terminal cleavage/methylation domain-containing protein
MAALRPGMTLIESLVAMALVVIAAAVMASAVHDGLAAQEDALTMSLAGTAAESRVAEYLAKPYAAITALDVVEPVGEMTAPDGAAFADSYEKFGRRTEVAASTLTVPDFPGLAIPGWLIKVTVSDEWNGSARKITSLQRFRPQTLEDLAVAGGAP